MPSSYHPSASTRSSRQLPLPRRQQQPSNRSSSVPYRQFIIVLTNSTELLRHTRSFQPQLTSVTTASQNGSMNHSTVSNNSHNNNNNNSNNREQMLLNLLNVELREATRDYLFRTRRSHPVHYVLDASDIRVPQT